MAADGSVVIDFDLNVDQAEKELAKMRRNIEKLESNLQESIRKKEETEQKSVFDAAQLDAEKAKLKEMKQDLQEMKAISKDKSAPIEIKDQAKANIPIAQEEVSEQQARVSMLQSSWNKTQGSVERYSAKIEETTKKIETQKEQATQLANQIDATKTPANNLKGAFESASASASKLGSRILTMAKKVFVFSIISSALRAMRGYFNSAIQANDEAAAAISRLKAALMTLAQPILQIIIPAFITFINVLTAIVTKIAQFVSLLFGTTLKKSVQSAKNMTKQSKAMTGIGKAANKTAKAVDKATGSLAAFDEINTIQTKSSGNDGGGAGGAGDGGLDVGTGDLLPDFSSVLNNSISAILELLTGVAFLAIGAILTFTGANVPLGIALMALGAAFIVDAVTSNPGEIIKALQGPIGAVYALVSAAMLVVGAVLAFSGINVPLGIALIAIGAAGLAAVVAANWNSLTQVLQGPIGIITSILSTALLVIGALILFSGTNLPLGLSLVAAGAVGMATVIASNWDLIAGLLQGTVGAITAIISGALLVIGAILVFSSANIPLGLGLMIAGAGGLAASIAANWDTVKKILNGRIGALTGIIGAALLVLGAILAFSGANIPLGIGLLAAGSVALATAISANWNTIEDLLQSPIGRVIALVSVAFLAIGAVLLFSGGSIPIGIGLLVVGAVGLATSIAANWNTIQNALGGPIRTITSIISASLLVLGVILVFTGAALPIGLGLMATGAAGLATSLAPNWDFLLEKLQGIFQKISSWWKSTVQPKISAVGNFFSGVFNSIAKIIKSVVNTCLTYVERLANGVIGGMNAVIRTLNNFSIRIPSWVPGLGGLTLGFNLRQLSTIRIPRLAEGAVIPPNKEFMAVLGDQKSGTNVEAPLNTIKQAVSEVLQEGGYQNGGDIHITVELDGKVVARNTIKHINNMTRSAGKSVLIY